MRLAGRELRRRLPAAAYAPAQARRRQNARATAAIPARARLYSAGCRSVVVAVMAEDDQHARVVVVH